MDNGGREKGETLGKTGAVLVWSSIGVLLILIIMFVSFFLVGILEGIGEEDFENVAPGRWESNLKVDRFSTIMLSVMTEEEEVEFSLEVQGPDGVVMGSDEYTTPLMLTIEAESSGEYTFVITVLDEGDFSRMEISIYSRSPASIFMCCGIPSVLIIFLALSITGLTLLMVALYKRNRRIAPRRPPGPLPPDYYSPRPYQQPGYPRFRPMQYQELNYGYPPAHDQGYPYREPEYGYPPAPVSDYPHGYRIGSRPDIHRGESYRHPGTNTPEYKETTQGAPRDGPYGTRTGVYGGHAPHRPEEGGVEQ
ncbi:MAG: hypothetical protein R6V01_00385 [Thermoplasmatota archaeon]